MSDFDIKINKITNANPYEKQQQIVSEDSYETSIFDDYCDDKINNQNDENLDYVEETPPIYEDTYENYTPYFFLLGMNQDRATEYLTGSQKKTINQLETEGLPTENAIIDIKRNGDIIISFREPNHNALVIDYNGNIKKELPVEDFYSYNTGDLSAISYTDIDEEGNIINKNTILSEREIDSDITWFKFYDENGNIIKEESYDSKTGKLYRNQENRYSENNSETIVYNDYDSDGNITSGTELYFENNELTGKIEFSKYEEDGNIIKKIISYNSDKEKTSITKEIQDKDGNVLSTIDTKTLNEIVEILHKDISQTSLLVLPSTGKDFEKHLQMLDKENIIEVMQIYQNKYGKPLDIAIKEEKIPDEVKNAVLNKMEDCLKKEYNYSDDFETTSQIKNKYYTGSAYDIVQDGNTMTITNKDTGKENVINIEKLTKNLPLEQKIKFKQVLQTIPAEVIIDMFNEDNIAYSDKINRAFYRPANDSVNIGDYAINSETLVHETGHALDYGDVAGIINLSMAQDNFGIMAMYNKELKAFIEAGNVQYREKGDMENPTITGDTKNYVTLNIREMFAETYCLLMLGDNSCKECIETYFPQTMNIIKNLIRVRRDPNLIINMYWS